jgi:PST family polysaccharide transporter
MFSKLKRFAEPFSPTLRKILKNAGWLFADKVIRLSVGVLVWVWIARYLGPGQFGILNYAIALVALLTPLAALGLDNIVVRDLVKLKDKRDSTLGSAFFLKFAGSFLTIIFSLLIILFLKPGEYLTYYFVLIIASGTVFQSMDVIDFYFQSEVKSRLSIIPREIAFLLASALKILLILFNFPLIAFAYVFLIEVALGSIGLLFSYKIIGKSIFEWKISGERIKELLKDCIPLAISSSAILLYMRIDIILIGELSNELEVGIYSAAVRISELFYFLSTIVSSSVLPILIEDPDLFTKRLNKIFDIMALVSYIIIIPIFIFSPLIIKIFGKAYIQAGGVLAIHIWSLIFVFTGVAQGAWYLKMGSGGLYLQLRRSLTGAAINIILNIILIPKIGSLGAAISTLISYAYVSYLSNLFNRETREIFHYQTQSFYLFRLFKRNNV